MDTAPTGQPSQPPQAGANMALKAGAIGCGGCGCLFALGGVVTFILAAAGAVNSSEVGTAVGGGIGSLVVGVVGLGVGVLCFVLSRKKPPAAS